MSPLCLSWPIHEKINLWNYDIYLLVTMRIEWVTCDIYLKRAWPMSLDVLAVTLSHARWRTCTRIEFTRERSTLNSPKLKAWQVVCKKLTWEVFALYKEKGKKKDHSHNDSNLQWSLKICIRLVLNFYHVCMCVHMCRYAYRYVHGYVEGRGNVWCPPLLLSTLSF